MAKKQQSQQPVCVPKLADDRLCWIAVRDHVEKKTNKVGLFGWIAVLGAGRVGSNPSAAGMSGDMRRDKMTDAKMDYAIAVDEAAQQLTITERDHLRATGEVPQWFLADIDRRAEIIRQQRG